MEHFFSIDLGDLLIAAAIVVLYFRFKKEIQLTDENALEDYEELDERLRELDKATPIGEMNQKGEYELKTTDGVKLTTFQIDSKEAK